MSVTAAANALILASVIDESIDNIKVISLRTVGGELVRKAYQSKDTISATERKYTFYLTNPGNGRMRLCGNGATTTLGQVPDGNMVNFIRQHKPVNLLDSKGGELMAHIKTTWVDNVTPISAENLNNLERQYDEANAYANETFQKTTKVYGNVAYTDSIAAGATLIKNITLGGNHKHGRLICSGPAANSDGIIVFFGTDNLKNIS